MPGMRERSRVTWTTRAAATTVVNWRMTSLTGSWNSIPSPGPKRRQEPWELQGSRTQGAPAQLEERSCPPL
jgi:hypothetical protein